MDVDSTNIGSDSTKKDSMGREELRDEIRAALKRKNTSEGLNDSEKYLNEG